MLNKQPLFLLIKEQAKKYGERTAMKYRDYERDAWIPISWNRFYSFVHAVSCSLLSLDLQRQERIAIFSQNKPECIFTAFGGYQVSAVTIPFYATSSAAQVSYMANDASVRYVFVGEQEQYDTMMDALPLCHQVKKVILFDASIKRKEHDHISIYFSDFLEMGKNHPEYREAIKARQDKASLDDMADILYTSGTTGQSKGVILTYGMYYHGFVENVKAYPLGEKDLILNFLPFTHIFERAFSYIGLAVGATLAVNLKPQDVLRSMQEVNPTTMCSVPRFWEKVYQGVIEKIKKAPSLQKKLMQDALTFGMNYWKDYGTKGLKAPLGKRMKYSFYDKTVYKTLRKTLGLTHPNFFAIAGAAVSAEIEEFVHGVGIYALCGYGLTESTATVSCDRKGSPIEMGSIGKVIEGIEIKFSDEGEILLRSKMNTPGYFNNESATKQLIDAEGWLHTGDAGYMKNGDLFLRERIKDLFKTSNGKYIAPQMIEGKLTIDRYVEQCVVIADQRKFVSALIVPSYRLLKKWAEENGITVSSHQDLCKNPKVLQFYKERIDTLQQDLAHYEKIKSFRLLFEPFTIENGELTNTLKMKRNVVYKRYAPLIDKMYEDAEKRYAQTHKN